MGSDDAKKAILARRAKFVAAAVALAGCGGATKPSPDAPPAKTAEPVERPVPCLSPVPGPNYPWGPDGGSDTGTK